MFRRFDLHLQGDLGINKYKTSHMYILKSYNCKMYKILAIKSKNTIITTLKSVAFVLLTCLLLLASTIWDSYSTYPGFSTQSELGNCL